MPKRESKIARTGHKRKKSRRTGKKREKREKSKRRGRGTGIGECAICLEDISSDEESNIKCVNRHLFHKECITRWIEMDPQNKSCPTCRGKLNVPLDQQLKFINTLLDALSYRDLNQILSIFRKFEDSVLVSHEFDKNRIPGLEMNILDEIDRVRKIISAIFKIKRNPTEILTPLITKKGYANAYRFIEDMFGEIQQTTELITKHYASSRIDDYRSSQMGLEVLPNVRNTTTRRADMISRPPRTERGSAITRRVRSR